MEGWGRLTPRHVDNWRPITLPMLRQLWLQIETICSTSFETTLFRSAFTLAFYGAFRSSELLAALRTDLHGPALARDFVRVQGSQLCITLR